MALFGREEELRRLQGLVTLTRHQGTRLVLVSGGAGMGKTALIRGLGGQLEDAGGFVEGRGWDNRAAVPYQALREAIGQLAAHRPGLAGRSGYLTALLVPGDPGRPLPPVDLLFQGLGNALAEVAAPVLVVFLDDLQWADEGTFEWLDYALLRLGATPVLWIGAYRSEERQAVTPLLDRREQWAGLGRFDELALAPLSLAAIEAWTRQALPAAQWQQDLPDLIWGRCQGLPLLAADEIRSLAQGQPFFAGGQAMIERRLGQLSAPARELLTLAAVIGERFEVESLAALCGQLPWETAKALASLVTDESLLVADGEAFRFAHSRYREALLAQTPAGVRQVYHDRVTRLTTPVPAEEQAYHLVGAGQVGPSIEALLAQGDQAARLRDWRDALRYYLEAQGLAAQGAYPEIRAALYARLGDLYLLLIREPEIAQGYYEAALRWVVTPRDRLGLFCRMAEIGQATSRVTVFDQYLAEAGQLLARLGEDPVRGWVLCLQAEHALSLADAPKACHLGRQALAGPKEHLPADVVARLQSLLLSVAGVQRDREEIERQERAGQDVPDLWQQAQHWEGLARAYAEAGYPRESLACLERVQTAHAALGWDKELTRLAGARGQAALTMSAWAEARQYLAPAVAAAAVDPETAFHAWVTHCRTWIYDHHPDGPAWVAAGLEALTRYAARTPGNELSLGKQLHLVGAMERISQGSGREMEFADRLEACRRELQAGGYQATGIWYLATPVSLPEPSQPAELDRWDWCPGHPEARWSPGDPAVLTTRPMRGFYQMNMPRRLRPVIGDFVLQATFASGQAVQADLLASRQRAADGQRTARVQGGGGLLLMHHQRDALRLFTHLREPGEVICTLRQQEQDRLLGRGLVGDGPIRLRLERRGERVTAYAGQVGGEWYRCGEADLPGWDLAVAGIFAECLVDLYTLVNEATTTVGQVYLDAVPAPTAPGTAADVRLHRRPVWQADPRLPGLVAQGEQMQRLVSRVRELAAEDSSVLIQGETGTGKELVARALHECGPRRQGPFVPVNCAAIPPELMERELFGHVRGAFTGAYESRGGLFETADGGTLFLDEIGEAAPAFQTRLLRATEEQAIRRVGDTRLRQIDVRVVAATNRQLDHQVAMGTFRQDLFYRLTASLLEMPPLRHRREEIPSLTYFALDRWCQRHQRPPLAVSEHAMELLRRYRWPGNVRELIHEVERAAANAQDGPIGSGHLSALLRAGATVPEITVAGDDELGRLQEALRQAGGNRSEAARLLGISRVTLYRWMHRLGLTEARRRGGGR